MRAALVTVRPSRNPQSAVMTSSTLSSSPAEYRPVEASVNSGDRPQHSEVDQPFGARLPAVPVPNNEAVSAPLRVVFRPELMDPMGHALL